MLTKGLIKNIGFQVVVAMVLGALVGAFMGEQASIFAPLGTLFIQLIKMLGRCCSNQGTIPQFGDLIS